MIQNLYLISGIVFILGSISPATAQIAPIQIDFSGATAEANKITIQGAGFDTLPRAEIVFAPIPEEVIGDQDDLAEGNGAIITAKPGEGLMIYGPIVNATCATLYRCSVRADKPQVSVVLASMDLGEYGFVSTKTVNNGAYFTDRFRILSDIYNPPTVAYQPLIQVVNTGKTETVKVYIDNLEIYYLDPTPAMNALPSLLMLMVPIMQDLDLKLSLF